MENKNALILPNAVISPTDMARLVREIQNLDEFFRQSAIRAGGQPQSAPRYSRLLDDVVLANKMNLLQQSDRELLIAKMNELSATAPVMHISFSADPPGPYIQKIVNWIRLNISGDVLVTVGLQPNIGAGCVVRTTNKSFDFSLRRFFESKHDFFTKKLHEIVSPELDDEQYAVEEDVDKNIAKSETEQTDVLIDQNSDEVVEQAEVTSDSNEVRPVNEDTQSVVEDSPEAEPVAEQAASDPKIPIETEAVSESNTATEENLLHSVPKVDNSFDEVTETETEPLKVPIEVKE